MKWRCASYGLMSSAALLLPLTAVPESLVQIAAPNAAANAAAHVNFKIVIPQVLYLQVGAQAVAVMSNGRNVTLSGTRTNAVLRASGRKVIAQVTKCGPATIPAVAAFPQAPERVNAATRYMCTASTP